MLCANRQDDEHRCCSLGVVVPLIGRSGIINNVIIIYICATYNIYYVKKRCLKEKSVLYIVEESSFRGNRCVVSNTTNACGETERRSILCEGWNSSATNCYKGPRIRRGRSRMKRDNKPAAEKYKVRRQACTRVYIYIYACYTSEKNRESGEKSKLFFFFSSSATYNDLGLHRPLCSFSSFRTTVLAVFERGKKRLRDSVNIKRGSRIKFH